MVPVPAVAPAPRRARTWVRVPAVVDRPQARGAFVACSPRPPRTRPGPRTGEFVNVGAIAGSADDDSWGVRQIQNERRAARLCEPRHLAAVHEFLALIADQLNAAEMESQPMPNDWLQSLHNEMRNVVQLSAPQAAVGQSASQVLDVVFDQMLIDPERVARNFVSKATLLASLRRAYKARIEQGLVAEKPEAVVGDHLRTQFDFEIGSPARAVQISQAWSFQKGSVEQVSTEVKSWGYALARLRDFATASRRAYCPGPVPSFLWVRM